MQTQRYRHRIDFQQADLVQDTGTGEPITMWVDAEVGGVPLIGVPAEVLTGPGREFIASDQKQAETTARINLRWFPGLDTRWRILWPEYEKTFQIDSIEMDATGTREYRLRCRDGVDDGG